MADRAWFVVLAILLVGCSGSSSDSNAASVPVAEELSTVSEEPQVATRSTVVESSAETATEAESTTAEDPSETVSEAGSSTVAPLRPPGDVPPPPTATGAVDDSVYISRLAMSDTSIEVKWSTHDDGVEYRLHRVPLVDDQTPAPEAMTADNLIHVAYDAGRFLDEDVESGFRYWYGLRAVDAEGVAVAHGWHRLAAVTDTEPPSPVGALSAVFDNGEVLVTWTRPDENYELHGYQVLRGVNGEDPETIVRTWNLDQTSFIDDGPPASGTVTYAVVATDFHWNESTPATVDVDLG